MKVKKSLKTEMITVFVGILLLILLSTTLINRFFLPKYYISKKEKTLINAYTDTNQAIKNDAIGSTEFKLSVERVCAASNIAVYAIDKNGSVYLSSSTNEGVLKNRLLDHAFGLSEDTVLEKTDHYQIIRTKDTRMQTDYMEMWGNFDDGSSFIMRTPLESITENSEIANRFLFLVILGVLVVGFVLALFFSRRITKPIVELTHQSSRMADLDFAVHFNGGGTDEIAVLGENFNRMSRNLEQTITELKNANLKLQHDIEKKEQLESMRSDFVSNVSHELKTPIALIQGYAEGLSDDSVLEDAEDRRYYADVILDEAKKMNQMVRSLLQLNQLEFGKGELDLSLFDLGEMAAGVVAANKISIEEAGIKVENTIPKGLSAWGDTFLIEEVFTNYLTNAIHHSTGEKRIRISAETRDKNIRINVFNTGNRIPEEDLPRLWEKFYKVDKAHTREYGGNGIGLSIVRAIMNAHSGAYGVRNDTDGVTFYFELDRSMPAADEGDIDDSIN